MLILTWNSKKTFGTFERVLTPSVIRLQDFTSENGVFRWWLLISNYLILVFCFLFLCRRFGSVWVLSPIGFLFFFFLFGFLRVGLLMILVPLLPRVKKTKKQRIPWIPLRVLGFLCSNGIIWVLGGVTECTVHRQVLSD